VQVPMTSMVMIVEITRDYAVIVPLMISNLVSLDILILQRQALLLH
jgi:CIC family chloride channel protein